MVASFARGRGGAGCSGRSGAVRHRTLAVALIALALVAAGCGSTLGAATPRASTAGSDLSPDGTVTGSTAAFYRVPTPLSPAPAGAIIRAQVIPAGEPLPAGTTVYRILYHSESTSGGDLAVSGMVIVPGGSPPPGGFPILSWAHGTTGLADQCAPSVQGPTSIPSLATLISRRMIVVATDYQGLGTPGLPPYLDGQSEAQGVLDAARAARALLGSAASNTVVVLGYSQGGQAALFAGQIAQTYAPELFVAGVIAVAPVTSVEEFLPTVPGRRGDAGAVYALSALEAWSATYGNIPLASVLTPAARRQAVALTTNCSSQLAAAIDGTAARRLFVAGWDRSAALQADARDNRPGATPVPMPLLVVEGTEDTLTPYATVSDFVAGTLCTDPSDTVQYDRVRGTGHDGIMTTAEPLLVRWIAGRLAGRPVSRTCGTG
jgi:pimeloyl-ACP methyl ester carboxylesterase